jgi:hypothetical protein
MAEYPGESKLWTLRLLGMIGGVGSLLGLLSLLRADWIFQETVAILMMGFGLVICAVSAVGIVIVEIGQRAFPNQAKPERPEVTANFQDGPPTPEKHRAIVWSKFR